MPIDYAHVMGLTHTKTVSYETRDTILYALGVGYGRNPLDESELAFVYENRGLKAAPTMACMLAGGGEIVMQSGVNYLLMVHGEQRTTWHQPLPGMGTIKADTRVKACVDKGEGKGAILIVETKLTSPATGALIATTSSSAFCRGDGGFGGSGEGALTPHSIPDRAPDQVITTQTRSDQALLYRLSGDDNPLHADPVIAAQAGFQAPILHGLCTYGIVCREIVAHSCAYDTSRLLSFDTRFSSPLFPGETIITELWNDGNLVSFRATVKERAKIILNNGRASIAPQTA